MFPVNFYLLLQLLKSPALFFKQLLNVFQLACQSKLWTLHVQLAEYAR